MHRVREHRDPLADRLLTRPVLAGERLADDRHRRARLVIMTIEITTAPNGNSHGREVPIPDHVHTFLMRRVAALRFRLAFQDETRGGVVPRWRELVDHAGGTNTRQLT